MSIALELDIRPGRQPAEGLDRLISRLAELDQCAIVSTRGGFIVYVNPSFECLTGWSFNEVRGQHYGHFKTGFSALRLTEAQWQCLLGGRELRRRITNQHRDGRSHEEDNCTRPFVDGHGQPLFWVSIGSLLSEVADAPRNWEYLATHDALTQLPNRVLFRDRLAGIRARAQRSGERFAVGFVDVDLLKPINDTLGHRAGDLLLKRVARHLTASLRASDTVARLGGDEFGLILPDIAGCHEVEPIMDDLLGSLRSRVMHRKLSRPISISIGFSLYPDDGEQDGRLLHCADLAMYQAKAAGGDGYCFYSQCQAVAPGFVADHRALMHAS